MKINVKILGGTTLFNYHGKNYKPGDTLTIDSKDFVPYLMVKVDAPKKKTPVMDTMEKLPEASTGIEPKTERVVRTRVPK